MAATMRTKRAVAETKAAVAGAAAAENRFNRLSAAHSAVIGAAVVHVRSAACSAARSFFDFWSSFKTKSQKIQGLPPPLRRLAFDLHV